MVVVNCHILDVWNFNFAFFPQCEVARICNRRMLNACNLALVHCVLAGETAVFIGSDHRASTERLSANGKDAQTDLGSARLHPRDETSQ